MADYLIKNISINGYNIFLLCLTFKGILNYLNSIENSPLIASSSGKIFIDQLLVTGNEHNRFFSCEFKDGKLDLTSARTAQPVQALKKLTVEFLNSNYYYVKNSILTDKQRQDIRDGIAF